jgi:hypothetical protein
MVILMPRTHVSQKPLVLVRIRNVVIHLCVIMLVSVCAMRFTFPIQLVRRILKCGSAIRYICFLKIVCEHYRTFWSIFDVNGSKTLIFSK